MESNDLQISLEPHLAEKLSPLRELLPSDLKEKTFSILDKEANSIPYPVLLSISQWSRCPKGQQALQENNPAICPSDYAMVSLLAGTMSSPQGKFGTYIPPKEPEELAAESQAERRAIVTLVNAVLSVAGATFAAFWAAEKTGWKQEWKVLFALFVAVVVASSEGVLYLIWSSRAKNTKKKHVRIVRDKKIEDEDTTPTQEVAPTVTSVAKQPTEQMRRRK